MEIDPADVNNGAFELDWNDKFIINLIRAGYKQKDTDTDDVIVDRWFQIQGIKCRTRSCNVQPKNVI